MSKSSNPPVISRSSRVESPARPSSGECVTQDGTRIHYKDWGAGPPIVLSHGWPLNSDSWEAQMMFLTAQGFRCVAHDRRGHGRSSQPWNGNDMDTFADDLAALLEELDLTEVFLVGFSMGGGEVARYVGRHGTGRLAKLALVSAVPPLMLQTAANPGGLPIETFDHLREGTLADRSQLYRTIASGPFFGANRPNSLASQGMIDAFWMQGMLAGIRSTYECIQAFSATDFTADLRKIDVPALIVHGDDDQIVPIEASAKAAARLIEHSKLLVYPGAPHGLAHTHRERLNADLLAFARG